MREIVNAIYCVLCGGIVWWLMPDGVPPWRAAYRWFARLRDDRKRGIGKLGQFDKWIFLPQHGLMVA